MRAAGIEDPHLAITEEQLSTCFRGEIRTEGKLSPETLPRPDTVAELLYRATIVNTCIRLNGFVEMLTHSATVNHGDGLRKGGERVCLFMPIQFIMDTRDGNRASGWNACGSPASVSDIFN